jgi:hypothetical protein
MPLRSSYFMLNLKMCRYSFYNYKYTYGCFKCQVGFKRRNLNDVKPDALAAATERGEDIGKDFHCPNCGGEMVNLGRDLRLPTKTKDEQWRCIEYLISNNYNVYSCGCQGIGFVPHKMKEAVALVAEYKERQKMYAKEQLIREKSAKKAMERKHCAHERQTKMRLKEVEKEEKNEEKRPLSILP